MATLHIVFNPCGGLTIGFPMLCGPGPGSLAGPRFGPYAVKMYTCRFAGVHLDPYSFCPGVSLRRLSGGVGHRLSNCVPIVHLQLLVESLHPQAFALIVLCHISWLLIVSAAGGSIVFFSDRCWWMSGSSLGSPHVAVLHPLDPYRGGRALYFTQTIRPGHRTLWPWSLGLEPFSLL